MRRRLRARADAVGVDPGRLTVEEIVDEAFLAALRRDGERLPSSRLLRETARAAIGREVSRQYATSQREVSLNTPVVPAQHIAGVHPDEEFTLGDLLPDRTTPLPAQVAEADEFLACLDQAFAELPEAWREVFFLHAVDGHSPGIVADRLGVPVETIVHSLEQTREYLRARLLELYDDLAPAA
mgnify:CR=1 FL=1